MSGELNSEVPTSVQSSTQRRIRSPLALNFSVTIQVNPEFFKTMEKLAESLNQISALIPSEADASYSEITEEKPFKATIVTRPDWITVPGTKNTRYYEPEEGKVILKYQSCTELETTWGEIETYSKMDEAKYKATCEKLFPKKSQRPQITGLNHLVRAYREGLIEHKTEQKPAKTEQKPVKKLKPGPITPLKHPVPGYKNLMYGEHKGQLQIWYSGSTIKTTWEKIEEVSGKGLKEADQLIIEIIGKKSVKNKMTALRQFIRAYDAGIVKKSRIIEPEEELEKNFARFQAEEDGDAAFRPMLSSYSTRPDENCGKVEGTMEV